MDVEAPAHSTSTPEQPSQAGQSGRTFEICVAWGNFVSEIWRRVKLEVVVELPLLKQRWRIILFGIVMQYVHGIFTQLAHRMHQPQDEPLHDVGFDLTPELGADQHWVSETVFGIAFAAFVLWTFSPFVLQRKKFYTAVMWSRLLMVLVVCQALRIVTFSVTQLPGPSFHCRAQEPTARRPWPEHWTGHLYVDVGRQVSKSCGDLIFSSHTIFVLTGVLTYNEYGSVPIIKATAWLLGVIMSFLIVASRKHYTVDIVIAWYTVPLVFYTLYRRWTTRRPLSELLSEHTEFEDVEGGVELDEVFLDRGLLLDKLSAASVRNSNLKIHMKAPEAGANGSEQDSSGKGGSNGSSLVRPRSVMVMVESDRPDDSVGHQGGQGDALHLANGVMQRNACRVS